MIYTLRLISGENEDFLIDIDIKENQTFFDLHNIIKTSLKFDESELTSFFITSPTWQKEKEITLFDMDEFDLDKSVMDVSEIKEFLPNQEHNILYVFDHFNERTLFGKIVSITKPNPKIKYPVCTKLQGTIPQQFLDKA